MSSLKMLHRFLLVERYAMRSFARNLDDVFLFLQISSVEHLQICLFEFENHKQQQRTGKKQQISPIDAFDMNRKWNKKKKHMIILKC